MSSISSKTLANLTRKRFVASRWAVPSTPSEGPRGQALYVSTQHDEAGSHAEAPFAAAAALAVPLVIDCGTEHELRLVPEESLSVLALFEAMDVEDAIDVLRFEPERSAEVLPVVRDYDAYILAYAKTESGLSIGLAPDDDGLELVAVFTSPDAYQAYVEETGQAELAPRVFAGPDLWTVLSRLPAPGMVFNCSGPAQPVAFAAKLAKAMLAA